MSAPADNLRAKPEEVRDLLRKHVGELTKALLSQRCRKVLAEQTRFMSCWYQLLEVEAKRKKRSPLYLSTCQHLLVSLAEGQLGSLARLSRKQLGTLEKLLKSIVVGLARNAIPPIQPSDFLALSKAILIERGKPGPKLALRYDVAFARRMKGERLAAIVRDLEPDNYRTDLHGTLDRYSKAIQRRRRQAARI